jgi:hypothetical protein
MMRRVGGYIARRVDAVLLVAALFASGMFICEWTRGHLRPLKFQNLLVAEPDDYVEARGKP